MGLTIDVVPLRICMHLCRRLTGTDMRVTNPTNALRRQQRKTPPDPPRITPIDKLVRPTPEPPQLDLGPLQLREPSQQPLIVDQRVYLCRQPRLRCEVGLYHDPRGERAKGVPPVCFTEGWSDVLEEGFPTVCVRGVIRLRGRGKPAFVRLTRRDESGRAAEEFRGE